MNKTWCSLLHNNCILQGKKNQKEEMGEVQAPDQILTELPVCVITLNQNYQVTYSNPYIKAVLGMDSESALGKSFFELIPDFERVKIEFLYRNLSFVQSKHTNSHYSPDFTVKINHTIYTHEHGITVMLEREAFSYSPTKEQTETQFKDLLDGFPEGILVVDKHYLKVYFSNKVFQNWIGESDSAFTHLMLNDLFEKQDFNLISKEISSFASANRKKVRGINLLTKKNERIPVEISLVETEWKRRPAQFLFITDFRNQVESERIQAEWQKYREILSDLAIRFINIPSENLAQSIEEALGIAANLSNSHRAFTLRLDQSGSFFLTDFAWTAQGLPSYQDQLRALPSTLLGPIKEELLEKKLAKIDFSDDNLKDHPYQEFLTLLEVSQMVMLPILEREEIFGIIGFAKVKTKEAYSESELIPIQIVSEIISNTLNKEKTESLLKESEDENRKVFRNLSTGIIYHDENGNVIKANPASLKLLGLELAQIQNWNVHKSGWNAFTLEGEPINTFTAAAQQCLNTGKAVLNEVIRVFRPDTGDFVWLSLDAIPELIPGSDQAIRVFTSLNDITGLMEAESNLEKNIKLLEAIVENSHSAIFVKDLDKRYVMVNRRWEVVTGFARNEVIGKKLEEYLDPELAETYTRNDDLILQEGRTTFTEEKLEAKETKGSQTSYQYFLSIKFPYRNSKGEIIGMCGIATDITAVKEAAILVEEREANLHGILESVSESIWSVDKNLNVLFTNQIFFNEFFRSYGVELLKGQNILKAIPDSIERLKWEDRYRHVLDSGQPLQFNDRIPTLNKVYHINVIMYPIKVNGTVEGVSVFSKDITEKIALEETSALYQSLFESATNEIYLIDPKTLKIHKANQAALRNTQYTYSELKKISIFDLMSPPEHANIKIRIDAIVNRESESDFFEFNALRKDGSTYEAEALIQYFVYNEESFISAFITDISDRKKTQQALQESELRFVQIFKENVTPMLLIDPHTGRIEDVNPSASSYYGYDRETFKTKNLLDVNYTFLTNPEEMRSATNEVMGSGKGKFLFNHKLKSGEIRTVEVFCSKITIENRELVHEIIQDVTDRTKYFEALVKQNEALKQIAWIQSHVVRAPLAKIMGLVQLLQDTKDDDDVSFDFILDAILTASKELDKVIFEISEKSNEAKHLFN